jgi:uncharacterized protein DUF3237
MTMSEWAPTLTYVLTLRVRVGPAMEFGQLPRGRRRVIPILAGEPVDPSQVYFKTVPVFETSAPELQWLTRAIFIGLGERQPDVVIIHVWKVE